MKVLRKVQKAGGEHEQSIEAVAMNGQAEKCRSSVVLEQQRLEAAALIYTAATAGAVILWGNRRNSAPYLQRCTH